MDKNYKKQLRAEFLDIKPPMGVITVYNKKENKVFIASSINLTALANKIKYVLNIGKFENNELQHDWNNLESENFIFTNEVIIPFEPDKNINYKKAVIKAEEELRITLKAKMNLY